VGPATVRLLHDPRRLRERMLHQTVAIMDATGRERVFLTMVRTWRRLHVLLCLLTLSLLVWHITFAITLLASAR
jgi:hypothetical protein